jgi:hypothetical protein
MRPSMSNELKPGFEEHLDRLREWIAGHTAEASEAPWTFYDLRNESLLLASRVIPETALVDERGLALIFEERLGQGPRWINLCGQGFLPDGRFLVSLEAAAETGCSATLVELSGPQLDAELEICRSAKVLVGLREQVAARLRGRGKPELVDQLLRDGTETDGPEDDLQSWPPESLYEFMAALSVLIGEASARGPVSPETAPYFVDHLESLAKLLSCCQERFQAARA